MIVRDILSMVGDPLLASALIVLGAAALCYIPGGVNGAIQKAAGPELLKDSLKLNGCPVGQAKVTGGYKLPCKHIIHAVAPHWCHGLLHEKEKLASCYRVSLALAREFGCKTVAFPLLGAGNCGIPYNTAMGIAVREISAYLRTHELDVTLVLYNQSGP